MGAILAPFMTRPMSSGVYAIPNIECRTTSVVTNTTPTVAYRGAGRPEATAAIERAMDLFAAEIGMDPADVRRINLIPPFSEPHTTSSARPTTSATTSARSTACSRPPATPHLRAEQAARAGSPATRCSSASACRSTSRSPGGVGNGENAKIEVHDDGTATIYTGTSPHGQGHDTAWSMIASAQTGIPIDKFTLVWGDTDLHARRRRDDGLALAAAGRGGRRQGRHRARRGGQAAGRPGARGGRGRHRARPRVGHVPRRRHAGRVEVVGRPRRAGRRQRRAR